MSWARELRRLKPYTWSYETLLQAQDFSVVGAAWVKKDIHCVVKYVSDYNFTAKDGTLGAVHSGGSLTKQ